MPPMQQSCQIDQNNLKIFIERQLCPHSGSWPNALKAYDLNAMLMYHVHYILNIITNQGTKPSNTRD